MRRLKKPEVLRKASPCQAHFVFDLTSQEVCQTLSTYNSEIVQQVLSSELLGAGINPADVTVVGPLERGTHRSRLLPALMASTWNR